MPDFYVEHVLEKALERTDECAFLRALDACSARARTRRYECLIDGERRRILYRVDASDASAVRDATRGSNRGAAGVWIGAVQGGGNVSRAGRAQTEALVDVVAEGNDAGMRNASELAALYSDCEWCLETLRVELVAIAVDCSGERMLALFRAPDAEAVRQAYRRVGGPFERVSALHRLAEPAPPSPRVEDPWSGSAFRP